MSDLTPSPSPPPIPPVDPGLPAERVDYAAGEEWRAPAAPPPREPYGPWASFGLTIAVLLVWTIVQIIVAVGYIAAKSIGQPHFDIASAAQDIAGNGLYLSLMECATLPLCGGFIWLLVRGRGRGARDYLALTPVPVRTVALWMVIAVVFDIGTDCLTVLLHHDVVPEFMRSVYRTAAFYPLLWLAIIVVGPFYEELLFRGFLFPGLQRASTGAFGAILMTAALWASLHLQYDWWGIAQVFLMGLLFGYARLRTGSIYTTLAMHAMANLQATIEVAYVLRHS